MVRRRLSAAALAVAMAGSGLCVVGLAACGSDRDMAETADMPDSAEVHRALTEPTVRDSMLDTLPGGEMVRGDSAAANRLLRDKMP